MSELGVDVPKLQTCVSRDKQKKLQHERENQAWSPRALRINGWRYSGILDADLVTRAICSAFVTQPIECKKLTDPPNPFIPLQPQANSGDGVTFGEFIAWLGGTVVLAFGALLLYRHYLKKDMRTTLREEVMLEVQAQMGAYSQM